MTMRNEGARAAMALCFAFVGSASLAGSKAPPVVSWGKPGVSFDDYRSDSIACGKQGATTSMKGRREFDGVVLGLDRQDMDMDIDRSLPPSLTQEDQTQKLARDYALNAAKSRAEPRIKALQTFLEEKVAACLSDKGYVRFSLTPAQAAGLGQYKKGSEARFRFLHALASNNAVVQQQRYDQ